MTQINYPGKITPTNLVAIVRLDSDWEDETGALHEAEAPEGFHRAEHVTWNVKDKSQLLEFVNSLPESDIYRLIAMTANLKES